MCCVHDQKRSGRRSAERFERNGGRGVRGRSDGSCPRIPKVPFSARCRDRRRCWINCESLVLLKCEESSK